ncbi:MAG: Copper binding protein plastocyanin/azurin family [Solirubrobacteraceae bacterium]|jgi:plastocyanin|nr:Copper binding protein plastocyanin/azurin family [Solirubrobacteraceae bacterium]
MRMPTAIASVVAITTLAAIVLTSGFATHPTPSVARAATTKTVKFGEYFYTPTKVTVAVGDSVRFVNVGKIEHTVADSTKSGAIRSTIIRPRPLAHGKSQTVRFRKRGTVYYVCTFHPGLMRGRVIVR